MEILWIIPGTAFLGALLISCKSPGLPLINRLGLLVLCTIYFIVIWPIYIVVASFLLMTGGGDLG